VELVDAPGWDDERPQVILQWVETLNSEGVPTREFKTGDTMFVRIGYKLTDRIDCGYFTVFFINEFGDRVQVMYSLHDSSEIEIGLGGVIECRIDDLRVVGGEYSLTLDVGRVVDGHLKSMDCVPDATQIRVDLGDYLGSLGLRPNQGSLAQKSKWRTVEVRE
jgi:hypothetical protein